jgi:transposase
MLSLSRNVRVLACAESIDLRKGFDGLFALARDVIKEDPLSGHFFLFLNRSRRLLKILVWDGTGLCILCKRLERGQFAAPWKRHRGIGGALEMTTSELSLLLEGSTAVEKVLSPPRVEKNSHGNVVLGIAT